MEMRVEVTSRETMKPSSPTPHGLKTFNLCLLDQMTRMYYASVVFFYPSDPTRDLPVKIDHISCTLKKSLAEALTRFYPLSGRLSKNNLYIDCNDAGVLYVEARVDCSLSEFAKKPEIRLLDKFLPLHGVSTGPEEEAFLFGIQVNVLSCGGIVIGTSSSHKIMDATTFIAFFRTWTAIATGRPDQAMQADCMAASTLFPSSHTMPNNAGLWHGNPFTKPGKSSLRRFVFDSAALSRLKLDARSEFVPNPTRIEALTGFIWKHAIRASRMLSGMQPPSAVVQSMNLRHRVEPPLPEQSIGNIAWRAFATYENTRPEVELRDLVESVRKSLAEINVDHVKKIRGDGAFEGISKWLEEAGRIYTKMRQECYTFVSWYRMGFYDVDFGWGRPGWVSVQNFGDDAFKNVVIMMDTPSGNGIEALIALEEQEMSILEQDQEFLASAKPQLSMVLQGRSKL
ncbi:hypothetical protein EUGRSUZ_H00427 [Eucalyptus grandis]|uniref:Uncharacterized protein n=2 Tax=Eucalyptus grandis TaxID=71139 RepID=A0ACC3JMY9_EUCGR|nr:hypothetical protein EUGRSUZ_H00427 [Eucalyptus grandis]